MNKQDTIATTGELVCITCDERLMFINTTDEGRIVIACSKCEAAIFISEPGLVSDIPEVGTTAEAPKGALQ